MKQFEKWTPVDDPDRDEKFIELLINKGVPRSVAEITVKEEFIKNSNIWGNDKYQVIIRDAEIDPKTGFPEMIWLSIKRLDKEPVHDWREFQKIKNMLIGEEHEAVEIYPAESRLVDTANQYHLWVLKEKGLKFPFGFNERFVAGSLEADKVGSKQRDF